MIAYIDKKVAIKAYCKHLKFLNKNGMDCNGRNVIDVESLRFVTDEKYTCTKVWTNAGEEIDIRVDELFFYI